MSNGDFGGATTGSGGSLRGRDGDGRWKLRAWVDAARPSSSSADRPGLQRRALAVRRAARRAAGRVLDVVEGFCTVTVVFDPLRTDVRRVAAELETAAGRESGPVEAGSEVALPVCYGGRHGPDLEQVAAFADCSADEVVALHSSAVYRVYMLGFLPGFAYLGSVDARIAIPRRRSPRLRVPAGSVGIAGLQTGVYPLEAPGGWHLIAAARSGFSISSGPSVPPRAGGTGLRFEPIKEAEYSCGGVQHG